jgi:hypothetical protein
MNAQDALLEVDHLNDHLIFLAECWKEEPNKSEWPFYEAKIRKMFPRVLIEKVTQRPFGFIIRAEDQRLQIKYLMHNPKVARTAVFSPIGRAAQKKARASK